MPPRSKQSSRTRAPHLGPERRRPQVLDAALDIAVREGIGAVTIGSIAAHMGVTRPVVYACFGDRVQVVESLLDREEESLVAGLIGALHESGGFDDPEKAFITGFTALLHVADAQRDAWRLLMAREPDPAVASRLASARALLKQRSTEWIRPAMMRWWDTPDLDRKLPVLIEFFVSTGEAAVRLLLENSGEWSIEELGAFLGSATYRAFRDA